MQFLLLNNAEMLSIKWLSINDDLRFLLHCNSSSFIDSGGLAGICFFGSLNLLFHLEFTFVLDFHILMSFVRVLNSNKIISTSY
jgi:hypothetical protein